jgi:predicted dehydrogenase/threonine dehydrogenase-like Zn-dependent dehydrogenase
MHQILQSYRTGELWLAQVPAPALRNGGAIVRTAASLVSAGTERMIIELAKKSLLGKARARPDLVKKVFAKIKTEGLSQTLEKVFAKLDTPIPLGYSCAGTVVEVGAGVSGIKPGDRVACGGAGYATHADLNYVPKNLMVKIPSGVSFEDASFTTLGAIAMQGVRQADVRLGERVVVIGLGLLGLLTVQILKASGCSVLGSDPDQGRCELARQLGADVAIASDLVDSAASFSEGHGADAVIITAATQSNQPIEDAAEICRVKGRVVVVGVVGMDVPREPFYKKELDLRLSMSYGPGRYDASYEEGGHDYPIGYVRWTEQRNMQSFLDLVAAGKVTPAKLVTHHFDISEALGAYELLETVGAKYLGIVINYPAADSIDVVRTIELRTVQATPQIGVGFIGAGNFAKAVLIPAIKKLGGVELVGLCTATGLSAAETAKKYDFGYATTDHQKILSDARINTVFIATRHDTHASLAAAALAAGKHVFVEKPLCVKPDQIAEYEQAILSSAAAGRCLMVGFNRRFSPHTRAIREAFASRGTPMFITYRINAGLVPRESWLHDEELGGGRIVGEFCHFVDWCEAVIGSIPVNVTAECIGTDDSRLKSEDSVAVNIRYEDGSVATIQYVSLGSSELPKERAEVYADGAVAVMADFVKTTFHGIKRSSLRTKQDKGFAGELCAFLDAIRRGGEAPISSASLARTTRITFAILDSLRTGKTIVAEPIIDPSEPAVAT